MELIAESTSTLLEASTQQVVLEISVNGLQGPPGQSGGGIVPYEAEADESIAIGQPIYIKSNGHAGLARADSALGSIVAGFARTAVSAGFSVEYSAIDSITRTDWSAIAGSTSLTPGLIYYLSTTPGFITTIAPTMGGLYAVPIGKAGSTTRLDPAIGYPVLLS